MPNSESCPRHEVKADKNGKILCAYCGVSFGFAAPDGKWVVRCHARGVQPNTSIAARWIRMAAPVCLLFWLASGMVRADGLKTWEQVSGQKEEEKKPDPCVATCEAVNEKGRQCDAASGRCDRAYKTKRKECKESCDDDSSRLLAACGNDEGCKGSVYTGNEQCHSSCNQSAYSVSECSSKDSICAAAQRAKKNTSCKC